MSYSQFKNKLPKNKNDAIGAGFRPLIMLASGLL
jgi:hypothetical protein